MMQQTFHMPQLRPDAAKQITTEKKKKKTDNDKNWWGLWRSEPTYTAKGIKNGAAILENCLAVPQNVKTPKP